MMFTMVFVRSATDCVPLNLFFNVMVLYPLKWLSTSWRSSIGFMHRNLDMLVINFASLEMLGGIWAGVKSGCWVRCDVMDEYGLVRVVVVIVVFVDVWECVELF